MKNQTVNSLFGRLVFFTTSLFVACDPVDNLAPDASTPVDSVDDGGEATGETDGGAALVPVDGGHRPPFEPFESVPFKRILSDEVPVHPVVAGSNIIISNSATILSLE